MVFAFGPQTLRQGPLPRKKRIDEQDPLTQPQWQGDAFGQYDPRKVSGYDPRMGMFSPPGQQMPAPPPAAGPADSEGGFDWKRALAVLGATLQDTGAALDGRQGGALSDFSAEEQAAAEANKRTKAQRELLGALQSRDPQTIRIAATQALGAGIDPSPFLQAADYGKPQPKADYSLGNARYSGDTNELIAQAPSGEQGPEIRTIGNQIVERTPEGWRPVYSAPNAPTGQREPPSGYRWGSDGSLEAIRGGPADKPQAKPEVTQDQAKNDQLYGRATQQLTIAEENFDDLGKWTNQALGSSGSTVGTTEGYQRAKNAVMDIAASYLYSVSGATANPGEVANLSATVFPKFGDSEQTKKDKKARLRQMVESMKARTSNASAPAAGGGWSIQEVP